MSDARRRCRVSGEERDFAGLKKNKNRRDRPSLISIAPAWRRPPRRAGPETRQRKSDAGGDQNRAKRIVLHLSRYRLRTIAKSLAAMLVDVPRLVGDSIGSVARGVLGLAVQILHRPRRLAGAACSLGLGIARDIAGRALDLTGEILCRTGNSILVHRVAPLFARGSQAQMVPLPG